VLIVKVLGKSGDNSLIYREYGTEHNGYGLFVDKGWPLKFVQVACGIGYDNLKKIKKAIRKDIESTEFEYGRASETKPVGKLKYTAYGFM